MICSFSRRCACPWGAAAAAALLGCSVQVWAAAASHHTGNRSAGNPWPEPADVQQHEAVPLWMCFHWCWVEVRCTSSTMWLHVPGGEVIPELFVSVVTLGNDYVSMITCTVMILALFMQRNVKMKLKVPDTCVCAQIVCETQTCVFLNVHVAPHHVCVSSICWLSCWTKCCMNTRARLAGVVFEYTDAWSWQNVWQLIMQQLSKLRLQPELDSAFFNLGVLEPTKQTRNWTRAEHQSNTSERAGS